MSNLLGKLHDDYLNTIGDEGIKKYYETNVLLQSIKELYAAKRTALSLFHKMCTNDDDESVRHSPISVSCSVSFLRDGGIMEGNFLANEEFKGVYFRPECGVVETGHFKNKVLFFGLRICENGDIEEGLFEDGTLMDGTRYLLNGVFEKVVYESYQ